MSCHSELDAELRGLTRLPADVLTMPAVPWIDMDEDDSYAWYVSLAGAIARAHELGRTCELRSPDGKPVAEIGPPSPDECRIGYKAPGCKAIHCITPRNESYCGARRLTP